MSQKPLIALAIRYFNRRGYTVDENPPRGDDSPRRSFDLIIRRGSEVHPVWIKDWNRTVGVNIIINIDKIAQSLGFPSPILVAGKFSEHAKAYANRRGIRLITKSDILKGLKSF
ncbi:MAG: restriction endonuclease [Candidatus Bathyarchaeota archaeon]|nr:restriction endonuclease [Candidatus Bathyarchaeota archaeon]